MTTHIDFDIFDGHNDLAYQLWQRADYTGAAFLDNDEAVLGITAHKASAGGLRAGLFALFVPQQGKNLATKSLTQQTYAFETACQMAAILNQLSDDHPSRFQVCRTATEIDAATHAGALAAVLHLEGAEAISPALDELNIFYALGVRSIGPLWSRPNSFGTGVPFSFPGNPDQGSGLTDAGKALVKACNQMNILLDVSHLNEAGFWDIARLSQHPLLASHSNAHTLCPSPRNLTDRQIDAIAESGGLVGVCFATAYLRSDGRKDKATNIELIIRQLAYLIDKMGEDHVGLGSDFDGAVLPDVLADCSQLPVLIMALQTHGFGDRLIRKLCWDNWYQQIRRL
jgi:membrane dipeptidase